MPLNFSALRSGLETLFTSPPPSGVETQWADIMETYSSQIIPPSITVSTAAAVLETTLATILSPTINKTPATLVSLEAAFMAFAVAVGLGMAPAFIAVPPPGLVGFATLSAPQPSASVASVLWATKIDTWMRTGIANPVPTGPSIPWS